MFEIDFSKYLGAIEKVSYSDKEFIVILHCDDQSKLSFKFSTKEKYLLFLNEFKKLRK